MSFGSGEQWLKDYFYKSSEIPIFTYFCAQLIPSQRILSIERILCEQANSASRLQRLFSPLSRALQKRYNTVLTAPH